MTSSGCLINQKDYNRTQKTIYYKGKFSTTNNTMTSSQEKWMIRKRKLDVKRQMEAMENARKRKKISRSNKIVRDLETK
jgi:hypothetical protein